MSMQCQGKVSRVSEPLLFPQRQGPNRTGQDSTALNWTALNWTAQIKGRRVCRRLPEKNDNHHNRNHHHNHNHTNSVTPLISNPAKKTRGMIRPVSQPAQTTPHHTRPTGRVERGDLPFLPTVLENPEGGQTCRVVSYRYPIGGGLPSIEAADAVRCAAVRCVACVGVSR